MPKRKRTTLKRKTRASRGSKTMKRTGGYNIKRGKKNSVELKNFDLAVLKDTTLIPFPCSSSLANRQQIINLANILNGPSFNERVGRKVTAKSIFIKMSVSYDPNYDADTYLQDSCRIMLVIDKQSNNAVPVYSDILQTGVLTNLLTSPNNLANKERFVVLHDKYYTFVPGIQKGTNSNGRNVKIIKIYKKLPNMEITYSVTDANTTPRSLDTNVIQTNNILLFCTSRYAAGASPFSVESFNSRLRYTDQ